ncbi:MAG: hypothetical protein ABRQ26_11045 [Syntrophomonadaceae bacterium]
MKDRLSQRLLGAVLEWNDEELSKHQPVLDALARLKYDEYQQFLPGMKFNESLALWLSQFETINERRIAFQFIQDKLIFVSSPEMNHLVDLAYPNVIKPILLKKVAKILNVPYWKQAELSNTILFKELLRKSLFLALSDGAHIGRFRRTNQLSNEQVHSSYELTAEKLHGFIKDLRVDIAKYRNKPVDSIQIDEAKFRSIFLLDDFSGSGFSLLRKKGEAFKGKMNRIHEQIFEVDSNWANALDPQGFDIYIIIYIMTTIAKEHVEELIGEIWKDTKSNVFVCPVYCLDNQIRIFRNAQTEINPLIEKYYDPSVMDKHLREGGTTDVKFGFADVGLPLVLSHNSPNDGLYLLWADENIHGLFPRISRHKEES